jgi:predicted ThiF/HesA family dinucleotide-utilizing enzyme
MLGIGEERLCVRNFYDLTQIHHGHPIANVLDDAKIVSDEQVGKTQLVLQIHQQVENLGLNADVEGG